MKKLTKKSLVLNIVSLLAACLLFFVTFAGEVSLLGAMSAKGAHYADLGYMIWDSEAIAQNVFYLLFLFWAVVLVVLNLLAFAFGDKLRTTVHYITLVSVLALTAILLLEAFIIAIVNIVRAINYFGDSVSSKPYLNVVFSNLIILLVNCIPVVLSAANLTAYGILLKKFPKTKCEKQIEAPMSENNE